VTNPPLYTTVVLPPTVKAGDVVTVDTPYGESRATVVKIVEAGPDEVRAVVVVVD
jgi:hypothetical protein